MIGKKQYAAPSLRGYGTLADIEREAAAAVKIAESASEGADTDRLVQVAAGWLQLLDAAKELAARADGAQSKGHDNDRNAANHTRAVENDRKSRQ